MAKRKNDVGDRISRLYTRNFSYVQVPMLDVPRIYNAAERVLRSAAIGESHEAVEARAVEAMREVVERVRLN